MVATTHRSTPRQPRHPCPTRSTAIIGADRRAARAARQAGDLDEASRLLERTHVLSRSWAWPHVRAHVDVLRLHFHGHDRSEVLGQVARILLAGPRSALGRYPRCNTGRSNVSATRPMRVPGDLAHPVAPSSGGEP